MTTAVLAKFAANLTLEELPGEAGNRLRDLFLDYIGISAFASLRAESTPAVRAAVTGLDAAGGQGTAIGEARTYSWPYAALLNGCYAHSLDFDDTNHLQFGHPGAPVIAAALAEAERTGADGRAFLEALAAGYEVSCRVGAAVGPTSYDRGFHLTATSGIFGAVAAVGRLRRFDAGTMEDAFGLALSKASGTMQYLANGSWNKRLHPGFAAHDALVCAALAESGVSGAAAALEGRYGLLTGYSDDPRPGALADGLGESWLLLETAIKPYPSCRFTHGAIDATLALRAAVPAADRARARLEVALPATAMKIVGEPVPAKLEPRSSVDAQFSVYFQVALAWLDGRVDWTSYDRIGDPDVAAMLARITTKEDGLTTNGSRVTIEAGGRRWTETVEVPLGEPGNWVGDDALRGKFLALAEPVYGPGHARTIAERVANLSPRTPMVPLISSLRGDPAR
ncbi:MmgE/PrpD family protein [Amycolatopsis sp. K13G38]|uniref:MmgE/PrpD family protein n=1 Tax=Amycolatopsis acididurans TaxID=2724524 RepID=A0ABX1IZI6_9PSEU|nr:MmgE/PrpD family protein [Amycolatopsis acididurans]NKQ52849.1 MmgE/PrpD family protein [Amycolatopsis acididurans]